MEIDELVERFGIAIEENRATVFVGAGLSRSAGYPSWDELNEQFRTKLQIAKDSSNQSLVAQYFENEFDRYKLIETVYQMFATVDPQPGESHQLLRVLPLPEIWTTNYDLLIETAIPDAFVAKKDDDLTVIDARKRRIYKMHGSIERGSQPPVDGDLQFVLTRDDFDQYPSRHPRFWRLFQAQFLTKSFLFLGFSLSDPNFEAVLKLARLVTPDKQMDHYALLKREPESEVISDLRAADLKRSGVEVIEVNDYEQVTSVLRRLVARTRPSRLFISGSQPNNVHTDTKLNPGSAYPTATSIEPGLIECAKDIGIRLAAADVSITTAGELGAAAGYALLKELGDNYDPERVMLVRRFKDAPLDPPNLRYGSITFIGEDPATLRGRVFKQVRAILILGGGDGTEEEARTAFNLDMGVIPVARTGGTALHIWNEMLLDLANRRLGERAIDNDVFERLNSDDLESATEAAVLLVRQAMFLLS